MPGIGVLFELRRCETRPGESVCVLGDRRELGGWERGGSNSATRQLRTSAFTYPHWTMLRPVWLELPPSACGGLRLEYKFVKDRHLLEGKQKSLRWEDRIPNRVVVLPAEDGALYLVSEAAWDCAAEAPRLARTTLPEVRARWGRLDPEDFPRAAAAIGRRGRPTRYSLSPRVSFGERERREYPIEKEFSALSSFRFGLPLRLEDTAAERGPDDEAEEVEVYKAEEEAEQAAPDSLEEELRALRCENALLQERLRLFLKSQAGKVGPPHAGQQLPATPCTPRRSISHRGRMHKGPAEEAKEWLQQQRCSKLQHLAASMRLEVEARFAEEVQGDLDRGPDGFCDSPDATASFAGDASGCGVQEGHKAEDGGTSGLQEPQEEPQAEDLL